MSLTLEFKLEDRVESGKLQNIQVPELIKKGISHQLPMGNLSNVGEGGGVSLWIYFIPKQKK